MSENTAITLLISATLAVIVGIVAAGMAYSWHGEHVDCLRLHEQTGYQTRMTGTPLGGGCYIYIDGRWVPDSRYRMEDPGR